MSSCILYRIDTWEYFLPICCTNKYLMKLPDNTDQTQISSLRRLVNKNTEGHIISAPICTMETMFTNALYDDVWKVLAVPIRSNWVFDFKTLSYKNDQCKKSDNGLYKKRQKILIFWRSRDFYSLFKKPVWLRLMFKLNQSLHQTII